jgi:hypothetical protein
MSGQLQSTVQLGTGPDTVTVRFAVASQLPVLAGGVCEVDLVVEPQAKPLYVLIGNDRGRPAFVSIQGSIGGVTLADPMASMSALGGPAGPVVVEPGTPLRQTLLANQFLRLEDTLAQIPAGELRQLELTLCRPLPLARRKEDAFAQSDFAEGRLEVPLRRDDVALEHEIARLADEIRAEKTAATSNRLERALTALASLRLPASRSALATLIHHPNALVRDRAAHAMNRPARR